MPCTPYCTTNVIYTPRQVARSGSSAADRCTARSGSDGTPDH